MNKNNLIVILHNHYDTQSPEDIVDIGRQAQWINEILQAKGYSTLLMSFSLKNLTLLSTMNKKKPVVVFNLVDAAPEEESLSYLTAGLLDYLKLPYTGCSFDNLYITTNKVLTKRLLTNAAIPTPPWIYKDEKEALQDISNTQFILKPTCEDASIGLDENSIVSSDKIISLLQSKDDCFGEVFIEGREFTLCMFGDQKHYTTLTPYEWVFTGYEEAHKEKIITYDAKWVEHSFGYDHIEAKYIADESDFTLIERLKTIARKCWKTLNLTGYIRIDFRVDNNNNPWVLEINCNPSFYAFYHLAEEGKFSFEDFIEDLLKIAF